MTASLPVSSRPQPCAGIPPRARCLPPRARQPFVVALLSAFRSPRPHRVGHDLSSQVGLATPPGAPTRPDVPDTMAGSPDASSPAAPPRHSVLSCLRQLYSPDRCAGVATPRPTQHIPRPWSHWHLRTRCSHAPQPAAGSTEPALAISTRPSRPPAPPSRRLSSCVIARACPAPTRPTIGSPELSSSPDCPPFPPRAENRRAILLEYLILSSRGVVLDLVNFAPPFPGGALVVPPVLPAGISPPPSAPPASRPPRQSCPLPGGFVCPRGSPFAPRQCSRYQHRS